MAWRVISILFFLLGILAMPVWPWSRSWVPYAFGFCWFVAILLFLVSVFARRGGEVFRDKGQG